MRILRLVCGALGVRPGDRARKNEGRHRACGYGRTRGWMERVHPRLLGGALSESRLSRLIRIFGTAGDRLVSFGRVLLRGMNGRTSRSRQYGMQPAGGALAGVLPSPPGAYPPYDRHITGKKRSLTLLMYATCAPILCNLASEGTGLAPRAVLMLPVCVCHQCTDVTLWSCRFGL